MDSVLDVTLRIARNAVRAGADAIVIADDYAGNESPFFSQAVFKEFVLPRLQRMVDAIHNAIHFSVKPENYRAMIEATKKFGRYPR
jgi:uroporphyrinogen-III decarboxylase